MGYPNDLVPYRQNPYGDTVTVRTEPRDNSWRFTVEGALGINNMYGAQLIVFPDDMRSILLCQAPGRDPETGRLAADTPPQEKAFHLDLHETQALLTKLAKEAGLSPGDHFPESYRLEQGKNSSLSDACYQKILTEEQARSIPPLPEIAPGPPQPETPDAPLPPYFNGASPRTPPNR